MIVDVYTTDEVNKNRAIRASQQEGFQKDGVVFSCFKVFVGWWIYSVLYTGFLCEDVLLLCVCVCKSIVRGDNKKGNRDHRRSERHKESLIWMITTILKCCLHKKKKPYFSN